MEDDEDGVTTAGCAEGEVAGIFTRRPSNSKCTDRGAAEYRKQELESVP